MSRRATIAAISLFWVIPGVVTGVITTTLFPVMLRGHSVAFYVTMQTLPWLVWSAATPAIAALVRRWPIERHHLWRTLAFHLLAALALGFLYTTAYVLVTQMTGLPVERPIPFYALFRSFVAARLAVDLAVYAGVVGLVTAIDGRRVQREQRERTLQLESDLARAQLQALQMQLQPHFLFNTLNAIAVLVHENPTAATGMITQLAALLRQTLSLVNVQQIPLRDEIDVLQRYLAIEQARFGDRLAVTIDVPAALLELFVPTFILQPIVENALRHGVAQRVEPGAVVIRAKRDGANLVVTVEDDGPGFSGQLASGDGFGLAGSRDRLMVLYGTRARLICEDASTGGARVTLQLPTDD